MARVLFAAFWLLAFLSVLVDLPSWIVGYFIGLLALVWLLDTPIGSES